MHKYRFYNRKTSILKLLLATLFSLCGVWQVHSQKTTQDVQWQGYWGAKTNECWNNKSIPPFGFFSDRVENWEAMCNVKGISKAGNSSKFDVLHLQCMSKNNEKYLQDMRLNLTSDDKLHLFWPGGVGFILERCAPES